MVVHVVIPVRDVVDVTKSICEQIQQQAGWDHCWIYDNGSTDSTPEYLATLDSRFTTIIAPELKIYEMWDAGFQRAAGAGAEAVAFLNNDIDLGPFTFYSLANALYDDRNAISYPDYDLSTKERHHFTGFRQTYGTYRHGGMSGFCFMLKVSKVDWFPLVDPQFIWWGGDDDIAFNVEMRGWKQIRVLGLPVDHHNEMTARHHNLGEQKGKDLEAVYRKWGK